MILSAYLITTFLFQVFFCNAYQRNCRSDCDKKERAKVVKWVVKI